MQMVHDYLLMSVDNKLSSLFTLDDLISRAEITALTRDIVTVDL